jgi:class 3 adenylate cyclase/tetratricopeptide (TPR) repeat protein
VPSTAERSERLKPYVPRLLVDWLRTEPDRTHVELDGTLAYVDISGFTRLTERLARRGKVGAEELSDILDGTFAALLDVAYENGAGLVKWGGDAALLRFDGPEHPARACAAAYDMRTTLRRVGAIQTSAGQARLRMSVGVHSGTLDFFLVGDPAHHRELIVAGPAATTTARLESLAAAGQIAISPQTAEQLDPRWVGRPLEAGRLLRARPDVPAVGIPPSKDVTEVDLREVMPRALTDHLLSAPGEAEHRSIAVGFVQFSGTDELLVRAGPDALAAALHEVVTNLQDAAHTHGVTFFESDIAPDGGRVMLTAGAPVSHGHDEDRMLRTVHQVVARAGRLPLRAGANRGPVFSGRFGPFYRRTYSVKGDAINLAARLVARAALGEVVVTQDLLDRAPTAFDTTPLAPFLVKGKARPVTAARLGAPQASGAQGRQLAPLVGRHRELELLERAVADLRGRRGGLFRVLGEPGIGKTRLVQALAELGGDLTVLTVGCDEYEQRTPYLPARRLFRAALGVSADSSPEQVGQRLLDRVAVNAPELLAWLPLLGIVLGVDLPPTRQTRELDEEFRKARLEEVALALLTVLLPTPTLVVVEDLHHCDDASLDVLSRVATAAGTDQPWLVAVSAREDDGRLVPEQGTIETRLVLGPLAHRDALALVDGATDDAPLTPATVAALVERASGNPLFLQALLLLAREREDVARLRDTAQLPDTVEDLVTTEIDRLPPAQRRVLRYAAVLGTTVEEDLLHEMLGGTDAAGPVSFAGLRAFIAPSAPGQLRFRHALIRDVAYDGLPFRLRRDLHEQAGSRLLARLPDPAAEPELLAHHFFHAARPQQAWTYCRLAGEKARAQYALAEAARFLAWAVESGRRAAVPAADLGEVLDALGDVRYFLGLSAEAAATYRLALRTAAGDPVRQASLLLKEGRVQQRMGNLPLSLRRLTTGIRLVEGRSDAAALGIHSQLATRYAIGLLQEGRYGKARQWGERGVRLGEQAADQLAQADAHNALEALSLWSGQADPVAHGSIARELYAQVGDLTGQGHCVNNLAVRAILEGRWDEGQQMLHQAAEIFEQVGDEASRAAAIYNQADVLVRQGRTEQAEPLLRQALRVARGVGDEETVALVVRESGKAAARAGRYAESRELLADAVARLETLGEPQELADAETAVAESYLLEGRWDEALLATDRTLAKADAAATVLPTLHRVRGFALVLAGDPDGARTAFEAGLALGSSPVARHEEALLRTGLASLAEQAGDPRAAELLASSQATLDGLGVLRAPVPSGVGAVSGRSS